MELKDFTPINFFNKVTYISDPSPGAKLKIPDGDFMLIALLFKLEIALGRLSIK